MANNGVVEKIEYQYTTNYKAQRKAIIMSRSCVTAIAVGGSMGFIAISWVISLIVALMFAFAGVLSILISLHNEKTVMILTTRITVKNKDKRISVPMRAVKSVDYTVPWYERSYRCGTLTLFFVTEKNRTKKIRVRHLFAANDGVKFIKESMERENAKKDNLQTVNIEE